MAISSSALKGALGFARSIGGPMGPLGREVKDIVRAGIHQGIPSQDINNLLHGVSKGNMPPEVGGVPSRLRSIAGDIWYAADDKYDNDLPKAFQRTPKAPRGTLDTARRTAMQTRQAALKNKNKGSKGGMR